MRKKSLLILVAVFVVLSSNMASAHRMHVSTSVGAITVKSWFKGASAVKDGEVKVYSIKEGIEELYITGTTDEEGEFSFPPKIGVKAYRIEVEATHMPGHRAETILNMSAIGSNDGDAGIPVYAGVIAGLGYLFGLTGLSLMYVHWKKQKEK
ncbi:MAG: hypothetical protein U9Q22_01145 [Candidatus Altiarchaeota archaeon]|nr:hypothetical protein [Candidatus Altiarchaeota archaeon]